MKTKRPRINVRLLRRIQAEIRKEPGRLNMGTWTSLDDTRSPCGATHCIAGWAETLTLADTLKEQINATTFPSLARSTKRKFSMEIANPARLLGLTADQSERLFYSIRWPTRYRRQYERTMNRYQEAKIAIARIDHFIKTKGRE